MNVLQFLIKIYPIVKFIRASPGSFLVPYKFVGADNAGSLYNQLFPARAGKNMQTCTKFTCLARN